MMPSASDPELDELRRTIEAAGIPIDSMTIIVDMGAPSAPVSIPRRPRRSRTREVGLRLPFDDAVQEVLA
jgi:hypothetical protein